MKWSQTLARFSPAQLKRFLVELANLQDDREAIERFQKRFADFVESPPQEQWKSTVAEAHPDPTERYLQGIWVLLLRKWLRGVWAEQSPRSKEWKVFAFRGWLYSLEREGFWDEAGSAIVEGRDLPEVPPATPFEQALIYLVKSADRARYCPNPECPAPYFFAERKNQRYCSEICAAPAQRELKRRWWAEHGEEWRKARSGKKSGKGKTSKKRKIDTRKNKKSKKGN